MLTVTIAQKGRISSFQVLLWVVLADGSTALRVISCANEGGCEALEASSPVCLSDATLAWKFLY